jgi:cyclopropane-fatty-acyl-phospholipid synthase
MTRVRRFALGRQNDLMAIVANHFAGKDTPAFRLELADGTAVRFAGRCGCDEPAADAGVGGDGAGSHTCFEVRVRTARGARAIASFDEARIAEAYLDEDIQISGDFLAALDLRRHLTDRHPLRSLGRFLPPLVFGQIRSDKRWIPRHYDYGNDFYFAFLDEYVNLYSQALFRSETETLQEAVRNKLDQIIETCRLRPGSRVLDVGAGWGALAKHVAPLGVHVTMLTLAHEQYRYLQELCASNHKPSELSVIYENIFAYDPSERYDAIVLLGVMEHLPDYPALFARFQQLLKPNGRVYMDFAAVRRKFAISSFSYRRIFPGNHSPVVLPDLLAAASREPFEVIAVHNDRHSYFLTVRAWARRLEAARARLVQQVGEPTYRLFQIYLWATAHNLGRTRALESYRVVIQKALPGPSHHIGLTHVR